MKKILRNNFSIEIPDNWDIESSESTDSIFDPDGNGALTISSYTTATGQADSEKTLSNFVKGKGVIRSKNLTNQSITESTYTDENSRYIYVSAISKDNVLILASYNCKKADTSDQEIGIVKKIIERLKIH